MEFQSARSELKKYRRLLLEADGAIEGLRRELENKGGGGGAGRGEETVSGFAFF